MVFNLNKQEQQTYFKYAQMNLPRHTSYPAAPFWKSEVKEEELAQTFSTLSKSHNDFSLYIHIPYCRSLCYYCGCNKVIYDDTRMAQKDPRESYLENLFRELRYYHETFRHRKIKQIHLGGGTPTFLSPKQLETMLQFIYQRFDIADNSEFAVEVDPRVTSSDHLRMFAANGFNRISLGVQDFDLKVQKAVNRVQPFELVGKMLEECKKLGFAVNFDLIYGLPYQTLESMKDTLSKVNELSPDRIAFYRLAMIPYMFKWQKSFQRCDLPEEQEMLDLNLMALNAFTEGGYDFIGLDHFAKKDDALSVAFKEKTLRRNFQGMTTFRDLEILGLGPTSISQFKTGFLQKTKDDKTWRAKTEAKENTFERFYAFTEDDLIRKRLIEDLYCYGSIDKESLEKEFSINFDHYFAKELLTLPELEEDGLVSLEDKNIKLSPILGRFLVRRVAANFDAFLQQVPESSPTQKPMFSKVG